MDSRRSAPLPTPALTLSPIIRPRALQVLLSVSHATVWRMVQRGELPRPIRVSAGAVGWRTSDIAAILDSRDGAHGAGRG